MGGVIGGILGGGGGGGAPPPIVPAPPPPVPVEAPPAPPVKEFRPNAGAGAGAQDENSKRRFAAGFAQNIKNGALGLLNNAQTQKQKLGQ
jgi:hypothetical protein